MKKILLVLAMALAACSRPTPGPEKIELPSADKAKELQRRFSVQCKEKGGCPASVGMLVFAKDQAVGVCTVSVAGENLIMTNRHCVQDVANTPGQSCSGDIVFKFPESDGYPEQTVDCDKLVSISHELDGAKERQDYAFLRTAKNIGRPKVSLSTQGFPNNEYFTIVRMTPFTREGYGSISKLKCKAAQGTVVTPLYSSDHSPIVHFSNCDVVSGNSGSPVFDSSGSVRGIVSQGVNKKALAAAGMTDIKPFGRGVNLSCMKVPEVNLNSGRLHQDCIDLADTNQVAQATERAQNKILDKERIAGDVAKNIEALERSSNNFLKWNVDIKKREKIGDDRVYATINFIPSCVYASDNNRPWLNRYRSGSSYLDRARFSYGDVSLQWIMKVDLDDDYRLTWKMDHATRTYNMDFSPANYATSGRCDLSISDGASYQNAYSLATCTGVDVNAINQRFASQP